MWDIRSENTPLQANEYIHSITAICPLAFPLSRQWTAWWDSSPPNRSTSPQALGGTHLHGNCNRVAVTEGGPLQPARKERQKKKKKKAFCVILEEEMQSKHFNTRGVMLYVVEDKTFIKIKIGKIILCMNHLSFLRILPKGGPKSPYTTYHIPYWII